MSARLAQQSVPQSELPKAKPRGKPWTSLPLLPLATGGDPLYFHLTKYKASALSTCQALLPTMQAAYGNMDSNEKSATMKAKCRLIARVCHPMPWVTAEGMWCPKKNMDSTMEAGSWPQWEVMECIKFSHQAVKSVKGLYMHGHYLIVNLGSADQSASPIKERAHRFLSSLFLDPPVYNDKDVNPTTNFPYNTTDFDCHHLCGCPDCLCPFHFKWMLKSEHTALHKKECLKNAKRDSRGRLVKKPTNNDNATTSS
jgi:hypothetical protein